MTAVTAPPTPRLGLADITPAAKPAGFIATTRSVAGRTLRKYMRTPQLLVVGTVQGALFLLIFRYVFGGAIDTGDIPYVDFLVPGFVSPACCSPGWTRRRASPRTSTRASSTGCGRCRCPGWRCWPGGRWPTRASSPGALAVTTAIGFLVGFRLHGQRRRRPAGLRAVRGVRLRLHVDVRLHRHPGRQRRRPPRACRCWCSRSRSCRAPTCRSTRCRAGCSRSPSTSRSRSCATPCAR